MAVWVDSQRNTVTGTSQEITNPVAVGQDQVLSCTVGTYYKVGATSLTATVGSGSHYCPPGGFRIITATSSTEGYVAVIKNTGEDDGACTLSLATKT